MKDPEQRISRHWKIKENKKHPYKSRSHRKVLEQQQQKKEVVTTNQ